MKFRMLVLVAALVAATADVALAQTISGLAAGSEPAVTPEGEDSIDTLLELAEAIARATTPEQRQQLEQRLRAMRTLATETGINLAIPAGATASVGKDQKATAGALLGFQAWKSDDFFAGAFFTFDAAPKLNGDSRKVAQFLRNPPNSGTSVYIAGSRMFWGGGGFKFHRLRPSKPKPTSSETTASKSGQQGLVGGNAASVNDVATGSRPSIRQFPILVGLAVRAGATSITLEHHEGDAVDSREASIVYLSPAILLTSRTFEDGKDGEYQFGLELGGSLRWLGGDASLDRTFLSHPDVFGHPSKTFKGLEGTFFVRLNAFQPFVRLTHIPKRDGKHIPGLTGVQAYFGINVQSALFQTTTEKARRGGS